MTELVRRFFADAVDHGDLFSGLFASEALLYGRFGFGVGTRFAQVTADRHRVGTLPSGPGTVRWARLGECIDDLAAIYDRTLPGRAGEITRTSRSWKGWRRQADKPRDGKPLWAAIHNPPDGDADGYAVYRVESKWVDHTAQNEVHILEMAGEGQVRAELWRFLLGLDLVRTVSDGNARLDEPVGHVMTDPRQLRCTGVYDQLWLRVIDVAGALSCRTYRSDGEVTIGVEDPFLSDASGSYRLLVEGGAGACEKGSFEPDVVVSPRGLATVYLGDRTWTSIAAAGLASVRDPAALPRLDAMFSTTEVPQCLTIF